MGNGALYMEDEQRHALIKFLDWILLKYCSIVDWIEHRLEGKK